MEKKNCEQCNSEFNSVNRQRIFLPCGDIICMSCFEEGYNEESASLLCTDCGDHVQIPHKLKDNVDKLKNGSATVWILCDEHQGQAACYYWHPTKTLNCWDCYVKNGWSTKNITSVS